MKVLEETRPVHLRTLLFGKDEKLLIGLYSGKLEVFDLKTKTTVSVKKNHSYSIRALAWSADHSRYATGSDDMQVVIWDAATNTASSTLTLHDSPVGGMAFLDNNKLVTAALDGKVRVIDLATKKIVFQIQASDSGLINIVPVDNGRRAAVLDKKGDVYIVNLDKLGRGF